MHERIAGGAGTPTTKPNLPKQDTRKHELPFHVVGMGASAGGLEALGRFFEQVPPNPTLAFVVVQHLSPDYKSFMVELLSKHTELPVLRAEDGMPVEPNRVYLIPPRKNMTIFNRRLLLIYLNSDMQRKILGLFAFALKPQRFLFLGSSETIGDLTDQFRTVDTKWNIFQNRSHGRLPAPETPGTPLKGDTLRARMAGHPGLRLSERQHVQERIYDALLAEFVPPGVVVNANGEMLHVFGDVSPFFKLHPGWINTNILKMAHKDIAVVFGTALHKVNRDRKEIVYRNLGVDLGGNKVRMDIRVKPLPDASDGEPLILVLLEHSVPPEPPPESAEDVDVGEASQQRIRDLEQALQYNEENLQATIEELETSNEELQATNEELVAANEELQSTNEELQSVNQELYTVNSEYHQKIQELTELNDDMNNILKSTRIGILFLDSDLCIRKFSPTIAREMNLLEQDVGRPLDHLAPNDIRPELKELARQVLETQQPLEREGRNAAGGVYLLRLVPYQADESQFQGVVLTLVDISDLHRAEEDRRRLALIVDSCADAIVGKDLHGRITSWNRGAAQLFGYGADEALGKPVDILFPAGSGESVSEILSQVRREPGDFFFETERRCKDGSVLPVLLSVSPIRNAGGVVVGASTIARDLTERKKMEEALRRERDLLARITEASPAGILIFDDAGMAVFANRSVEEILGTDRDALLGRCYSDPIFRDRNGASRDGAGRRELPIRRVMETGERIDGLPFSLQDRAGTAQPLSLHLAPLMDAAERSNGVVVTLVKQPEGPTRDGEEVQA